MQESIQLVIDSLPFLLKGAGYTLQLSIGGMFFGLLLGFILAADHASRDFATGGAGGVAAAVEQLYQPGKRYVAGRDNPGAGAVPSGAVDYLAHAGGVHHVPGGSAHLLDHGDCVIDVAEPF